MMINTLMSINDPIAIFLIILGCAIVIAAVALIIYKVLHPKLKQEEKKIDEEKAVQEELNRVLEPIDDEKLSQDIQNYKSDEDKPKK